ncbi:AaceriAGL223Cp [[Ashbya] aceris (nom. inval.)]|nr:AaceriAGL223Cp [[Ashbya] aceris (nom. inval.)]
MGASQAYIHLRPANLLVKNGRMGAAASVAGAAGSAGSNHMLRIHLERFPSLIGHSSSRINRRYNEDAYSMRVLKLPSAAAEQQCLSSPEIRYKREHWRTKLPLERSVLNISIFDGHGGDRVSKLLAECLHEWLVATFPSKRDFFSVLKAYRDRVGGRYWSTIYARRELFYDRFIRRCNTKQEQVLQGGAAPGKILDKSGNIIDKKSLLTELERLRIYLTFLKHDLEQVSGFTATETDTESAEAAYTGGSTATSIYLTTYDGKPHDESFFVSPESLLKLVVTQVGDTKVVLCDKNGIAHSLVRVHHPDSPRESDRLSGNFQTDSFGDVRFLNNFANTRAFGDRGGKREGLTCEPDIYSYLIGSTRKLPRSEHSKLPFGGDECFLCLITDGVSDLMSDQELVDLITSTVNNRGLKVATPQYCSDEVIRYIMAIGSNTADNATCIVLRLSNWGNWPVIDRTGAIREEKLMSLSSGSDRNNV